MHATCIKFWLVCLISLCNPLLIQDFITCGTAISTEIESSVLFLASKLGVCKRGKKALKRRWFYCWPYPNPIIPGGRRHFLALIVTCPCERITPPRKRLSSLIDHSQFKARHGEWKQLHWRFCPAKSGKYHPLIRSLEAGSRGSLIYSEK